MKINYFNNEFDSRDVDFSKVKPFSHVNVTINCDEPLSQIGGELEKRLESFFNSALSPYGLIAKWDNAEESYQLQERSHNNEMPRISKLCMGVDFQF